MADERTDHDVLIALSGQVENLTATMASNAKADAATLSRIDTKIDALTAKASAHDIDIMRLRDRPASVLQPDEARRVLAEHQEMWGAYRIGRWIAGVATSALIVQAVGIAVAVIVWISRGG